MIYIYYILCLIPFFSYCEGQEPSQKKPTICLNMIVKNEIQVITRGLASVKPIIDYWVIVDTGSTDGTQDSIKAFMKDIPGELHERPWKNFEHNRNEALELAKGKASYILFMDADDVLEFAPTFKMPPLLLDSYNSAISYGGMRYDRPLMIKDGLDWKWYGVLHEYLHSPRARSFTRLEGVTKVVHTDGARSKDSKKYQKDAQILEAALEEDPTNSRYVFYLAQSYRDAGDHEVALKNYQKRVEMGGWDQEVFWSLLQAAHLEEILDRPREVVVGSYYRAYHYRPSRAEPLDYLARYYRSLNEFAPAYLVSSIGMTIPFSKDALFVEKWIYDYDMQLECSISAYWIGKYEECQRLSKQLLEKPDLPQIIRDQVEKNLAFANAKILERSVLLLQK